MTRALFVVLLVVHGLIHSIGLVDQFHKLLKSRPLIEVSPATGRIIGTLWLVACLLFLIGATLFLLNNTACWWVIAIAVLLSQVLIIIYWHDARFGTIPNVLILIVAMVGVSDARFNTTARRESDSLSERMTEPSIEVSPARVAELPSPVRQWLLYSGVIAKTAPVIVHLQQTGSMRTSPEGRWMPFHASQVITVSPPGFVWNARIQVAPLLFITGRDRLDGGKGNMLIKFLSAFTIANSSGPQIDESTLIRYLAEMVWYPQAATSEYIRWEAIDATHARAVISRQDVSASGIFAFADSGEVRSFEASRYGDFGGEMRKEAWHIDISEYKSFNGRPIGTSCVVTWKLDEGDFTWLKLEIVAAD